MRTGFFQKKCSYDGLKSLVGIKLDGENFLHGACSFFALALAERFGYTVYEMTDYYDRVHLVHAFAVANENKSHIYVDVRGVTDNFDDILEPFDQIITEPIFRRYSATQYREELLSESYRDSVPHLLAEANAIIENHVLSYQVK